MSEPKKITEPDAPDLAEAIRRISDGVAKLTKSGLNRKAVVVLLSHATGVGMRTVEDVLDGLGELAKRYTTQPARPAK